MFRNRNNSQKPPDELLANFKAAFPALRSTSASSGERSQGSASLTEALDVATTTASRPHNDEHEIKERDATPRGNNDQWRFTPSLFDPNSFSFSSFANQPPGYYTPTPGGTNTLYHPQAGDLHTPGFTLGLGTPLSMPTSENTFQISHVVHPAIPTFANPPNPGMAPQVFQNVNPFAFHHSQTHQTQPLYHGEQSHHDFQHHQSQSQSHQQHHHSLQSHVSHSPHRFSLPAVFEPFGHAFDASKLHANHSPIHANVGLHDQSPVMHAGYNLQNVDQAAQQANSTAFRSLERYHVTLSAPTAMVKSADEIPITYLNKGQAYTIVVADTRPSYPSAMQPAQYRTFVRVSFEDEQQRQRPAACWQLWKEGRGTNEAHHRGGRLQAVEFVDPNQTGSMDAPSKPQVEIESSSFDGFSVLWTPAPNAPAECSIAVRFNFLSTDFSHSKGVKGIPVRLCAKTELRTASASLESSPEVEPAEVCFCKVKLFRDHGAERKLSNDVAHVKKSIDKLKQQIAQAEAGVGDSGKRKRSNSLTKGGPGSRPSKIPKHKRTWSVSSDNSAGGNDRNTQEDDLQIKLQSLQDMFTSTRPTSLLYLKGEEMDDMDLHPVQLVGGEVPELTKQESTESGRWEQQNSNTSVISPTPSSLSIQQTDRRATDLPRSHFNPPSRVTSDEWPPFSQTANSEMGPPGSQFTSPTQAVKVARRGTTGSLGGWIDAVGVDSSYQPPPEPVIKPVACFYFQSSFDGRAAESNLYQAIYPIRRSLKELVYCVASKSGVESARILQVVRVTKTNLEVVIDDEMVTQIPEGQDFVAEFAEMHSALLLKQEWTAAASHEVLVDGDISSVQSLETSGYSLRLHY